MGIRLPSAAPGDLDFLIAAAVELGPLPLELLL